MQESVMSHSGSVKRWKQMLTEACTVMQPWIKNEKNTGSMDQFVLYSTWIHTLLSLSMGRLMGPKQMLAPCPQLSFLYQLSSFTYFVVATENNLTPTANPQTLLWSYMAILWSCIFMMWVMKNSRVAVLVLPGMLRHDHTLTYFSVHATNKCPFSNLFTIIFYIFPSFKKCDFFVLFSRKAFSVSFWFLS